MYVSLALQVYFAKLSLTKSHIKVLQYTDNAKLYANGIML